ncbi:HSP70-interacting protein 1 [Wolffia australiana]
MDSAKVIELKNFVEQCKENPSVLSDPSIAFFRDYLESLGCKLPASAYETKNEDFSHKHTESDEDEVVESDVELEGETVEPDHDPPQKMGDASVEVSDDNREASQLAKGKGMEALSDGKLDEAIEHLTEAVLLNPSSAIMYATRASVFIKMKKPNAAIRDADAALEINPDSAKGYKSRGMALALLGKWEEAAKDLHTACKLDYDEETSAVLKKVEPNAHRLEEHRRKYERLRRERAEKKAERERQRRRAEAQAAYEKAKKAEQSPSGCKSGGSNCGPSDCQPGGFGSFAGGMPQGAFPGGMPGMPGGMPGMPGAMPGMPGAMPGMPGAMPGMPDMSKILNDPDLMAAFKDPEIMAALQDVMKNPANFAKHQANPKVAPIIAKMMGKFGGGR